uniref:Ankyrin repeat protein n=1 Tax=viral metagenome TaxID=1070528 RepID=A0A6C0JQQ7_9ZZZZ
MNAYDLSESLPKVQQVFNEYGDRLEERLKDDRSASDWSPEGFIEADPTANKIYLRWIVNSYILGGIKLYEDVLSRTKPALEDYSYLVESGKLNQGEPSKPWTNERNIDNYCGLAGCTKPFKSSQSKKASSKRITNESTKPIGFTQHGLDGLLNKYSSVLEARKETLQETEQIREDTEKVFESNEVVVYHPKTEAASCYYGQGTKWCTAATKGENMFNMYNKSGPLYIIIPKKPKVQGEKYQMHVKSGQLMDINDVEFSIITLLDDYPTLNKFQPALKFKQTKQFLDACKTGDTETVALMISSIDPADDNNLAIRGSSKTGQTAVVRLLLADPRVDPSAQNNNAIIFASEYGHTDVVRLLLEDSRVDPSSKGNWPIRIASRNGHVDVVRLLLTDPRVDPSGTDNAAIQWASRLGHVDVVKELLKDSRVDPSANNNEALKWASEYGHTDVVKLLLTDPRVSSKNNYAPAIQMASKNGHTEIVKLLEEHQQIKKNASKTK